MLLIPSLSHLPIGHEEVVARAPGGKNDGDGTETQR